LLDHVPEPKTAFDRVVLLDLGCRQGLFLALAMKAKPDLRLSLDSNVFIADRVVLNQARDGGPLELGDRVHIFRDTMVATGAGGRVTIGRDTFIQPRCQIMGYKGPIEVGRHVQIAPNCAFYSYDHSFARGRPIGNQPIQTKAALSLAMMPGWDLASSCWTG
jgi:acetyltransferase-like isoleucine patch superfamily enzyme